MKLQDPLSIALLIASLLVIAIGVFFRLGRLRAWAAPYRNPLFPTYMRHSAFAAIPFGLMFLVAWLALILDRPATTLALFPISLLLAGVGFFILFRAPDWARPAWLRANGGSDDAADLEVRIGPFAYLGLWGIVGAAVVSWWVLNLPLIALIVSLAFVAPLLVAYPRR